MRRHQAIASSYYPPRARWHGCFWYSWFRLRRASRLDRLGPDRAPKPGQLLAGLVVPGWGFVAVGWERTGLVVLASYGTALLLFFVAIGRLGGDLAFAYMLSAHVTGVLHLLMHWCVRDQSLLARSVLTLTTLAGFYWGVYGPARSWVTGRLAMPMRIGDRVIVIRPGADPAGIQRGDAVAYRVGPAQGPGYWVREGVGLDPVLALPGDEVSFFTDRFEVNGASAPLLWRMPCAGEIRLPEKYWLIWPHLDITNPGNQPQVDIPGVMLRQIAMVSETQLIGKPYRSWFGRRQVRP